MTTLTVDVLKKARTILTQAREHLTPEGMWVKADWWLDEDPATPACALGAVFLAERIAAMKEPSHVDYLEDVVRATPEYYVAVETLARVIYETAPEDVFISASSRVNIDDLRDPYGSMVSEDYIAYVTGFNDLPETDHDLILSMFDEAIRRLS